MIIVQFIKFDVFPSLPLRPAGRKAQVNSSGAMFFSGSILNEAFLQNSLISYYSHTYIRLLNFLQKSKQVRKKQMDC